MALGNLKDEADLRRFLEAQARTPGVLPPVSLPFKNIKFGTGTLTFGGGSVEASGTVTHGLGDVPVFATPIFEDAGYVPGSAEKGDTTFLAKAQKRDGTEPGAGTEAPFCWVAIC